MIKIKVFDGTNTSEVELNENIIPVNYKTNIGNDHLFKVENLKIEGYIVNIVRPDCEGRFPVMYLLPGLGGYPDEWLWSHYNLRSIVSNLLADGKIKECVYVLPQVVRSLNENDDEKRSDFHNFANVLKELIMPEIEKKPYVLAGKENTGIGGLSYGGKAALYIAYKMQQSFSVVAAFEPSPGLLDVKNDKGEKTVDGLIHNINDFSFHDFKYVFIGAGDDDKTVGKFPESYFERLHRNSQPNTFCILKGGHDSTPITKQFYIFAQNGKII